jgi:hypothetical protein
MAEEKVLGSIQINRLRGVEWVRVTEAEGWARTLLRVLSRPDQAGAVIQILPWVDQGFTEGLQFKMPDPKAPHQKCENWRRSCRRKPGNLRRWRFTRGPGCCEQPGFLYWCKERG